jgi:hypothetical protein
LLYKYKSTDTDAEGGASGPRGPERCIKTGDNGTHFTCFTGTKVQILTQKAVLVDLAGSERVYKTGNIGTLFICLTGTKVQILTQKAVL